MSQRTWCMAKSASGEWRFLQKAIVDRFDKDGAPLPDWVGVIEDRATLATIFIGDDRGYSEPRIYIGPTHLKPDRTLNTSWSPPGDTLPFGDKVDLPDNVIDAEVRFAERRRRYQSDPHRQDESIVRRLVLERWEKEHP